MILPKHKLGFQIRVLEVLFFTMKIQENKFQKSVIQVEQPFYFSKNPSFVKMVHRGFNPNFKYFSRTIMRIYCLTIYEEYKGKKI